MRIERLDLIRYGHFEDVTIDFPTNAQLVVVLGPNEAGKSTLMRALDALFYGINSKNDDHFGSTKRNELRVGARLTAADGHGLDVVRQSKKSAPLLDRSGEAVPVARMAEMLGHADHRLFQTLFHIDYAELVEGADVLLEVDGEIGRLLFGASLGSLALTKALERVDDEADRLFKPRAPTTEVNKGLKEYRSYADEARQARIAPQAWSMLDEERQRIDSATAEARAARSDLHAQVSKLDRVQSTLPLLTKYRMSADELTALRSPGEPQSTNWADDVAEFASKLATTSARLADCRRTREGLEQRLTTLDVDHELLRRANDINRLFKAVGAYRNDRDRRPVLEAKQTGHQREIDRVLERLGLPTSTDPASLIPVPDTQVETLRSLADDFAEVSSVADHARAELEDVNQRVRAAETDKSSLPTSTDTTALEAAHEEARQLGSVEKDRSTETASAQRAAADVEILFARLGLADRSIEESESVPVPPPTLIARFRDDFAEINAKQADLDSRRRTLDAQREELEEQLAEAVVDVERARREDLVAARSHRDQGWTLIRGLLSNDGDGTAIDRWKEGSASLEEEFEGSVFEADRIADERFDHAERLAEITTMESRIADLTRQLATCGEEQTDLDDQRNTVESRWRDEWAWTTAAPAHPDDADAWVRTYDTCIGRIDEQRDHERRVSTLLTTIDATRSALVAAMPGRSDTPVTEPLDVLIKDAHRILGEANDHAAERKRAEQAVASVLEEQSRRERAVEQADAALTEWTNKWAAATTTEAIQRLDITKETTPSLALVALKLMSDLRTALERLDAVRDELSRTAESLESWESDAEALVNDVSKERPPSDPADAVVVLHDELAHATEQAASERELEAQCRKLDDEIADLVATEESARGRLGLLREKASIGASAADIDMEQEVDRARQNAELNNALSEIEATLLEMGDGRTVDDLLKEAAQFGHDGDRIAAERARLDSEIGVVEAQLADLQERLGENKTQLAEIDGTDDAADLDQQAQAALAAASSDVDDYLRSSLAAQILRRVVDDYAEKTRGPILNQASEWFQILTRGAFVHLVIENDGNEQLLRAERHTGELLDTEQLSSGTRDQLYLALRLAGVKHHLDQMGEPLPLILDDLLINFDAERTAAALAALSKLAESTQVILFTHNASVVAAVSESCDPGAVAVIDLACRDADASPTNRPVGDRPAADEPPPAQAPAVEIDRSADRPPQPDVEDTPPTEPTELDDVERRLLEAIAGADEPLGRSALLEQTGLDESDWGSTIDALLDDGAVQRIGRKRGTKYFVPDADEQAAKDVDEPETNGPEETPTPEAEAVGADDIPAMFAGEVDLDSSGQPVASDDPHQVIRQLVIAEWGVTSGERLPTYALLQQRLYARMVDDESLAAIVVDGVPSEYTQTVTDTLAAAKLLLDFEQSMKNAGASSPNSAPADPAQLIGLTVEIQESFGIPWHYLASTMVVGTRFDRHLRPPSLEVGGPTLLTRRDVALPDGDSSDPIAQAHTVVTATAGRLRDHAFATDPRRALAEICPATGYAEAVIALAETLVPNPERIWAYAHWTDL